MLNDPIENIAELLIKKERINKLPVDIESIALKYSKLKKIDIPFDFDGITIKEKGRTPQIIINKKQVKQRKNFTIAHELGHIIIPWHVGIILDQSIDREENIDYEYAEYEAEANKFSSSLLLPTNIIKNRIKKFLKVKDQDIAEFIKALANEAEVSILTTIFRIIKFLPPNYIYIITNNNDEVEYSGSTKGTGVKFPFKGQIIDDQNILNKEYNLSLINFGQKKYYLIKVFKKHIKPVYSEDINWRETLNCILSKNFDDEVIIDKTYKSVNAIIGSYYGTHLKNKNYDFDTFYNAIYERVSDHDKLLWLVHDELYEKFINQKISELYEKQ